MSGNTSLLVEQLWRLKRLVDRGECSDVEFIHLNNLLREPNYRMDVLRRAEASGSEKVRALVREIRINDPGMPLMARTDGMPEPQASEQPRRNRRRHLIWLAPVVTAGVIAGVGFTALEPQTIRVSDDITEDTTWQGDKTYVLENVVFVDNATLTIQPGARIQGENGAALIVTRDSQLQSRGRPDNPVVFTSAQAEGQRTRGDWGGIVLLGKAPVNQPSPQIEGLDADDQRGRFGGTDEGHSCGVIEYTRIEFAGYEVYKNNELNGLTLGGCGRNSIIRNVQVHRALDDGIEMFGGTVDLKNILVTGAADDSIDWDWGWRGRVQFAVIQQHADVGDNAFEGDNNGDQHEARPRSEPVFYNVTLAGTGQSAKTHRGMVLREGTGGHFHNMIIDSYGIEAMDTRDEARALVASNILEFTHNVVASTGRLGRAQDENGKDKDDDFGFDEMAWISSSENQNQFSMGSVLHPTASNPVAPDFRPRMPMREMNATTPPTSEFFDESATFNGAINPRDPEGWLTGWTAFPES